MNKLESFLSEQREQGDNFESSEFTLDSMRALEKMSRYQLKNPALWIVKVVQAAVAAKSTQIKMEFGKKVVKVSFDPEFALDAKNILSQVLSGELIQESVLFHLITALRSCVGSTTEEVQWTTAETTVKLSAEGCLVSKRDKFAQDFVLEATRPSRSRSLSQKLKTPIFKLASQTLQELDAVKRHCWVCPIPINLDGRPLERGYHVFPDKELFQEPFNVLRQAKRITVKTGMVNVMTKPIPAEDSGPGLPYPLLAENISDQERIKVHRPSYLRGPLLHWQCPQTSVGQVVSLRSEDSKNSTLYHVLDGAVVTSTALEEFANAPMRASGRQYNNELSLALHIVEAISPERLDISHFGVSDINTEASVRRALPVLREMMKDIRAKSWSFVFFPGSKSGAKITGLGLGAQSAFFILSTKGIGIIPLLAGTLGFTVMSNTAGLKHQLNSGIDRFQALIEERFPEKAQGDKRK